MTKTEISGLVVLFRPPYSVVFSLVISCNFFSKKSLEIHLVACFRSEVSV